METAVSTLSTFNTSKDGIKRYVDQVVSEIKAGVMNPLLAKIYIKSMQKSLEDIEKQIFDDVMNEAYKYTEKNIEYKGAIISKEELGTKYDFGNCNDVVWNNLNKQIIEMTEKRKEREAMLKAVKQEGMTLVDEQTGETWKINPPIKTSTTGIKVTIK
jgi:uncharacterized protein YpbB